jgi:tetratricopeptide (TPR) repeat protein
VAAARSGLGDTLRLLGRLEESLAQHELAVAIQRDLGTRDRQFLDALDWLGQAYAACGRHDEARRCWTEALRLADETATLRRRT